MITKLFRITHHDGDDYHSALSGSLKASSAHHQHTDLDFYCAGGKKISCHRALILRFSSTLSALVKKQTCCECLGEDCTRGHDTIGISLADVKVRTMMGLLDLLYTGQTKLVKKVQDATEILELANLMLGMRLPKGQLSLEAVSQDGGIRSNIDFRRANTMPRPMASFNQMVDVVLTDEESDLTISNMPTKRQRLDGQILMEETDFDLEGTGKRKCPKCSKPYSIKWMTRHVNTCTGEIGDEIDAEDPDFSEAHQSSLVTKNGGLEAIPTGDSEVKQCPYCGNNFKIKGGWITRHIKSCTGRLSSKVLPVIEKAKVNQPARVSTTSETSSNITEDRGKCPKCGEYFQNRGGVFFKHINQCNVAPPQSKPHSSGDTSCNTSGKTYPPSSKKNQIKHQEFCIGTEPAGQNSTSQTEKVRTDAASNSSQEYAVDPVQALSLYANQNWKCFLCGSICRKRDGMKAHLVLHFRNDLEAEEPATYESLQCSRCKYIGSDKPILFIHIALTHQVLRKYIPTCLHDILFSKHTLESAKHSQESQGESHAKTSDATKSPFVPPPVAATPAPAAPIMMIQSNSLYGEEKSWTCFLCQDVFKVKNHFKYHIIKHYRGELKKFLNETNPTICTVCGVNGANFDSTLSHVAWTHQKIRELLTKEQGNYIFGEEGTNGKTKPTISVSTIQVPEEKQVPGALNCSFCGSKYSRRTELKSCLMTHVKAEVEKKYFPDESIRECSLCHYKAGSKDHLLTHMCLTHRKICDFLTPEYAELVFGRKRGSDPHDNTITTDDDLKAKEISKSCNACDSTFSSESELKEHRVSCNRVTCGKCKELFKDAAALKKHELSCNPAAILFKCHLCEKSTFDHPHFLKGHLSSHYKDELCSLVSTVQPDDTGYFKCSTCDYMTPTKESLAVHLGYKHSMFLQFLPKEVSERYSLFAESVPKKDTQELSNGETLGRTCPKCKKSFSSPSLVSAHMSSCELRSTTASIPKKGKHVDGKCIMCAEPIQTFLQYKCHLFGHFEESITKDWGEKYEKDLGKCIECGSSDAFVEGEKLSTDGKSAFVRHLAIDHDKIFTYLSPEIRDNMRNAFSEGLIALPATPPPPQTNMSDPVEFMEIEPFNDTSEDVDIQIEAVDDTIKIDTISP